MGCYSTANQMTTPDIKNGLPFVPCNTFSSFVYKQWCMTQSHKILIYLEVPFNSLHNQPCAGRKDANCEGHPGSGTCIHNCVMPFLVFSSFSTFEKLRSGIQKWREWTCITVWSLIAVPWHIFTLPGPQGVWKGMKQERLWRKYHKASQRCTCSYAGRLRQALDPKLVCTSGDRGVGQTPSMLQIYLCCYYVSSDSLKQALLHL